MYSTGVPWVWPFVAVDGRRTSGREAVARYARMVAFEGGGWGARWGFDSLSNMFFFLHLIVVLVMFFFPPHYDHVSVKLIVTSFPNF